MIYQAKARPVPVDTEVLPASAASGTRRELLFSIRIGLGLRHLWVRRASAFLVAVVASYAHQRRFALAWGSQQVSAVLWPLSVDGLVILASLGLLEVGPGRGLRVRWSVRAALLLGWRCRW
ncbi:MAG TPA: DUF2637 domain-containing protein [Pseudonocardiaceae bacterium]|jgi:hypothetical protein|nr:DUF2637 domain-containing protein [Pseudonocardiaceae bacterium]